MEIKLPFCPETTLAPYISFLSSPSLTPSPPFLFNNALLTTSPFDQGRTREDLSMLVFWKRVTELAGRCETVSLILHRHAFSNCAFYLCGQTCSPRSQSSSHERSTLLRNEHRYVIFSKAVPRLPRDSFVLEIFIEKRGNLGDTYIDISANGKFLILVS